MTTIKAAVSVFALAQSLKEGDITAITLAANPGPESDLLTLKAGQGLFRFSVLADEDYDIDSGDVYNPAANPDIDPAVIKRQRAAELRRVRELGVWGVLTQVRPSIECLWETPDQQEPGSLWGLVGGDFIGSGYDSEQIKSAAAYFAQREQTPPQPVSRLDYLHAELRAIHESETDDDTDFDEWVRLQSVTPGAQDWLTASEYLRLSEQGETTALLNFDGFGFNDIADPFRSRVFTMSAEYKPGGAKEEQGRAILAALFATGVMTDKY